MPAIQRVFSVNGRPFFPVGGQARNSSAYCASEWEPAFKAVKLIHGNLLEIPVYWEQVEPEEGRFDFTSVDGLLECARRFGIKLILLWFGTWKNGDMDYSPPWVKTNPQRFQRVTSPTGAALWVLSSHCDENLKADCRAFTRLCEFLKNKDESERTVIAIQVENEPGILGSDRDYGLAAQAEFLQPAPAELVEKLKTAPPGRVHSLWQKAGAAKTTVRRPASWSRLFGEAAGEYMTAWSIARYIDRLAEAGKVVYDIPMYINVWLGEGSWGIAGESYPSGGAVGKTLEIYKWFTPHIDLIAPDIYIADGRGYEAQCAQYARADNPLFVPESGPEGANAWNLFRAVADYNAIGYAFFAVEHILAEDGTVRPENQMLVDSFRCLAAAAPLLLQYQGTGKVHAVVEEENLWAVQLKLDGYLGQAQFHTAQHGYRDWRHRAASPSGSRGRGLVIQAGLHELYLVGSDFRLLLRRDLPPGQALDAAQSREFTQLRQAHYVRVEEGHFDEQDRFVVDRRRNGDEFDFGVWVEADTGVVHVLMCD